MDNENAAIFVRILVNPYVPTNIITRKIILLFFKNISLIVKVMNI
jgi:hypothetical protein